MAHTDRPQHKPGVTENSIRTALDAGRGTLCTHVSLLAPEVMEAVGRTGVYDYVEVVVEYGTYDTPTLESLCRTAELYGMGTMIKISGYDTMLGAQRAVAAGFEGVLFAEVRSPGDVRSAVASVRPEHPDDGGLAGLGARRYLQPGYVGVDEYVARMRGVAVVVMIEKPEAVNNIEEIVKVPGLDMILWGPLDYSLTLGRPGEVTHPKVLKAGRHVIETAKESGIPVRADVESVEEAQHFLDLGVQHFGLGGDLRTLYQSLQRQGRALRDAMSGR